MNQSGYQHKFWKAHLCSPLLLLAAHRCGALAGGSPPFSQMLNVGASNCSGVQAVFQRIHIFIYLCAVVTKVTRGFNVVKIQLFSVQDTFSTLFKKSNISKTERVRGAFSFSLTIITVSKAGFFFNIEREHFLWVNLIKGLVNFLKHTWKQLSFLCFYSTPSTEGVESTRGNSVCLSVCLFVRNHFFFLQIFNNLMI